MKTIEVRIWGLSPLAPSSRVAALLPGHVIGLGLLLAMFLDVNDATLGVPVVFISRRSPGISWTQLVTGRASRRWSVDWTIRPKCPEHPFFSLLLAISTEVDAESWLTMYDPVKTEPALNAQGNVPFVIKVRLVSPLDHGFGRGCEPMLDSNSFIRGLLVQPRIFVVVVEEARIELFHRRHPDELMTDHFQFDETTENEFLTVAEQVLPHGRTEEHPSGQHQVADHTLQLVIGKVLPARRISRTCIKPSPVVRTHIHPA